MWRYNVNGVSHHRNPKVGVISAAADEWRRGMPADAGGAYHVGSGQHTYRGLREKATKELLKHLSYNNFSRERVTCTAAAQRRAGLSGWWKKVALQWALRWAATARHIEVSLPEVGVLRALDCIEQREHQSCTICGNRVRSLELCKGGGYPRDGCPKKCRVVLVAVPQASASVCWLTRYGR